MQDKLAYLITLLQDKENIIENLMLRYASGDIKRDEKHIHALDLQEMDLEELRHKAETLAQRTILENFDLRVLLIFQNICVSFGV